MMKTQLKDRLKILMSEANMTQKELSLRSGVSQANLSYILSGKRTKASVDVANRLAVAFGVSVSWLLGEGEDSQPISTTTIKVYDWDSSNKTFIASTKEPEIFTETLVQKLEGIGTVSDCIVIEMKSSNMEPLLFKGDRLTINLADKNPFNHSKPRVFALTAFDSFGVYRIFINLNQVKLESENPHFEPVILSVDDFQFSVEVLGRVVDRHGSSGL